MKKALLFGAAVLLLTGAGCSNTTSTPAPESKSAGEAPVSTLIAETPTAEPTAAPVAATDLTLTGESTGGMVVSLKFTVPEGMDKDVQGYRLLMGHDANPTKETATDWYMLGTTYHEKNWTVNATGQRHFRVCGVKANQCTSYSNDLEIDVK